MLTANAKHVIIDTPLNSRVLYAVVAIILSFLCIEPVIALSIEKMVDKEEVQIYIRLQNEPTPIVRQQLIFEIEVATKYLFEKPTKYKKPIVKDTASSPRKSPGFSSSNFLNGEMWNSQVREFALYPIKQGQYRIPPIDIYVALRTSEQEVVEGTITTSPYFFDVTLPNELSNIENFIVSTDVRMEINNDQSDVETFSIGDAYSLTVAMTAVDVPGMLLPKTLQHDIKGVSVYRKPPHISEKTNRGFLTGQRTDSVTYIFEGSGTYQLPQQLVYWWNPELHELNELIIPARTWLVNAATVTAGSAMGNTKQLHVPSKIFTLLLLMLLSSVPVVYLFKYRQWLFNGYAKITKRQQRILCKEFRKAINAEQYLVACQKLYQLVVCYSGESTNLKEYYQADLKKMSALRHLLTLAYTDNIHPAFGINQTKLLLSSVKRPVIRVNRYVHGFPITLNP